MAPRPAQYPLRLCLLGFQAELAGRHDVFQCLQVLIQHLRRNTGVSSDAQSQRRLKEATPFSGGG